MGINNGNVEALRGGKELRIVNAEIKSTTGGRRDFAALREHPFTDGENYCGDVGEFVNKPVAKEVVSPSG